MFLSKRNDSGSSPGTPAILDRPPKSYGRGGFNTHEMAWSQVYGLLAQMARAPALQAGGQGFDSLTVHDHSPVSVKASGTLS